MTMKPLFFLVMVSLLAACSGSPSSPSSSRAAPLSPSEPASLVAAVRAVGQAVAELEVQPLRDPQVQDLRDEAEALEAQGKYTLAEARLDQALAISVDDPDLLQWKAELSLYRKDWSAAERLATQSFDRGPKLGGLCRRNWATLQYARAARGDSAGADAARQKIAGCTVAPPVRM
jgi:tetratricopeptide (TPR) repeat protein